MLDLRGAFMMITVMFILFAGGVLAGISTTTFEQRTSKCVLWSTLALFATLIISVIRISLT